MRYFFPLCSVIADEDVDQIKIDGVYFIRRDAFAHYSDLRPLSENSRHILKVPCEILNIYFNKCNLEVTLEAEDVNEAILKYKCFRALLYSNGITPYISPCVCSHSLDQINSMAENGGMAILASDSLGCCAKSNSRHLEIYPIDTCFETIMLEGDNSKTLAVGTAINTIWEFFKLYKKYTTSHEIRSIIDGMILAPQIPIKEQSLLYIWTVLESLFPQVNSEVSFRMSLYISHLFYKSKDTYDEVKKSYNIRSRVAHGSVKNISYENWNQTWRILCFVSTYIFINGKIPTEAEIIERIFAAERFFGNI